MGDEKLNLDALGHPDIRVFKLCFILLYLLSSEAEKMVFCCSYLLIYIYHDNGTHRSISGRALDDGCRYCCFFNWMDLFDCPCILNSDGVFIMAGSDDYNRAKSEGNPIIEGTDYTGVWRHGRSCLQNSSCFTGDEAKI